MKITFTVPHKSIPAGETVDLPMFTVLTGVNGSGKTHFLEAIIQGAATTSVAPTDFSRERAIKLFDPTKFNISERAARPNSSFDMKQYELWKAFDEKRNHEIVTLQRALASIGDDRVLHIPLQILSDIGPDSKLGMGLPDKLDSQCVKQITRCKQNVVKSLPKGIRTEKDGISPCWLTITREEFTDLLPIDCEPVEIFQQRFADRFGSYKSLYILNERRLLARTKGRNVPTRTDEEFLRDFGPPPWTVANSIFESAGLNFRINEPDLYGEEIYVPKLTDTRNGIDVKFGDLSSGEKVLMGFALAIFSASDPLSADGFPKLLLLDEVDAPLHPSMIRSLLRAIEHVLVEKHGMHVILATHSPTTVALAPSDSLYVIDNRAAIRVKKISKDQALGMLTAGVPALSIEYENRRQIFVESEYDAKCYGELYELCRKFLAPEISLTFIAAGRGGSGGCDQVRHVVENLRRSGNVRVRGIIDRDQGNRSTEDCYVFGNGERYSLENYVFDPVFIGLFLNHHRFATFSDMGLPPHVTARTVADNAAENLPVIAGHVVSNCHVGWLKLVSPENDERSVVKLQYADRVFVDVPSWYVNCVGHDLERILKDTFPQLRQFSRGDGHLKREVIAKSFTDFPDLMPMSIIESFRALQTLQYT